MKAKDLELKRRDRGVFAHPEDVHCVVFHLFSLAAYGLSFWIWLHPDIAGLDGFWNKAAFVGGAALMLGWISGVNVGVNFHNHAHVKIFRQAWVSRWFGRIWTFSGGWPAYYWQHSHVTVHHKNVLNETDWTLPRRKPNGKWESCIKYSLLHWPFRYVVDLCRDFKNRRGSRSLRKRFIVEASWFFALWSIPFFIDPLMGLVLWLLPHYVANVMVMGPGMYAQHAGCEMPTDEHPYRHSNTFTGRFFNLAMFNIGYHIEHHTWPTVHWSNLPELHRRAKDAIVGDGAHVVPYGYYKAGFLLSRGGTKAGEFFEQHPDYPVPEGVELVTRSGGSTHDRT